MRSRVDGLATPQERVGRLPWSLDRLDYYLLESARIDESYNGRFSRTIADCRAAGPTSIVGCSTVLHGLRGIVILNNADVLVAYFVLKASQLGVYSAAAVLPKAIVTATQPIAQILLPILIAVKGQTLLTRNAVYKAIAVTAVMGIAGFAALWLGSGVVCGSRVGIRFCEPNLMLILATAAVMLAVVRTAMTIDLGYRLYYLAHLPFLGFVAFVIFELIVRPMPYALAGSYALASACILGIFGLLSIIRSQFRGAVPAPQSTT